MKRRGIVAVLFAAICFVAPVLAVAQGMVVGVNVVNPMRASVTDQNALLGQLKAAQVRVIRCGISDDVKGIDFAKRAAAQGIRIQLIVGAMYPPNAPSRPYQPNAFPAMWGGHPLSFADPALSQTEFQHLFDSLDANGIVLAGVELGNEINWAAFNPEFPLPGEGKILGLQDLANDPEGKQIAKGFLKYIRPCITSCGHFSRIAKRVCNLTTACRARWKIGPRAPIQPVSYPACWRKPIARKPPRAFDHVSVHPGGEVELYAKPEDSDTDLAFGGKRWAIPAGLPFSWYRTMIVT